MKISRHLNIRTLQRYILLGILSLFGAVGACSEAAAVQTEAPPRYQIYGGYSYLSNTFNGVPGARQSLNGWEAALAFPPWHGLRFKIDTIQFRGTNSGAPQNAFFILGGEQWGKRLGRETLFVEGLAGDVGLNQNWGPNQHPGGTASFSTYVGGGMDFRIQRHFAFRAGGGYQYSNFALIQSVKYTQPYRIPGLPNNFGRITSGFVWMF